ncbi:MAG: hypothetical protein CML21_00335 [Rheinheimera sp.]|nr:hypothetical protein [Rheinheimera sp.]
MVRKTFFDEPGSSESIADNLSQVIGTRDGSNIEDRLNSAEPLVDLHQVVHMLTPRELLDAINVITDNSTFTIHKSTFTHYLSVEFWYANALIETATPQFAWDENSATEDVVFSLTLKSILFNDAKRINRLNFDYPTVQVSMSDMGTISIKSYQTLKGGRTLENLLWTAIHFFHDAERIYKDLTVFSGENG